MHSDFDEWQWIEFLASSSPKQKGPANLITPVGSDDCAIVRTREGYIIFTSDAQIEGVHFKREWADLFSIGWKGMTAAYSDLACKGISHSYTLLNIAFPESITPSEAQSLWKGIVEAANTYQSPIIGGNTAKSAIPPRGASSDSITMDFFLASHQKRPIPQRRDAQPGDLILVLGELGYSRTGFYAYSHGLPQKQYPNSRQKFIRPKLIAKANLFIAELFQAGYLHAAMDISDGLLQDLNHIIKQSGYKASLSLENLPLPAEVKQMANYLKKRPLEIITTSGEEYVPLLTLDPKGQPIAQDLAQKFNIPLYTIGTIIDCPFEENNGFENLSSELNAKQGFSHFNFLEEK